MHPKSFVDLLFQCSEITDTLFLPETPRQNNSVLFILPQGFFCVDCFNHRRFCHVNIYHFSPVACTVPDLLYGKPEHKAFQILGFP
jgi:hypothetical protein